MQELLNYSRNLLTYLESCENNGVKRSSVLKELTDEKAEELRECAQIEYGLRNRVQL
jgi:hypothetical protein